MSIWVIPYTFSAQRGILLNPAFQELQERAGLHSKHLNRPSKHHIHVKEWGHTCQQSGGKKKTLCTTLSMTWQFVRAFRVNGTRYTISHIGKKKCKMGGIKPQTSGYAINVWQVRIPPLGPTPIPRTGPRTAPGRIKRWPRMRGSLRSVLWELQVHPGECAWLYSKLQFTWIDSATHAWPPLRSAPRNPGTCSQDRWGVPEMGPAPIRPFMAYLVNMP